MEEQMVGNASQALVLLIAIDEALSLARTRERARRHLRRIALYLILLTPTG